MARFNVGDWVTDGKNILLITAVGDKYTCLHCDESVLQYDISIIDGSFEKCDGETPKHIYVRDTKLQHHV